MEMIQRIHGKWCSASAVAMGPDESKLLADRVQLLTDELVLKRSIIEE